MKKRDQRLVDLYQNGRTNKQTAKAIYGVAYQLLIVNFDFLLPGRSDGGRGHGPLLVLYVVILGLHSDGFHAGPLKAGPVG